jgi:nitrite reductase/ring-hydroxylating ferredoxin subunit
MRTLGTLTAFAILLIISSCQKNNSQVPNVAVDEYLNLNLPEYLPLNAVNNWIYYNYAGYKGIIVIQTAPGEFTALERSCTYDPSASGSIITALPGDIFGVDSVCNSKFSLIDGSVVNGPATRPLIRYRTALLANNILHIYN